MKQIFIILISIFSLSTSFALGVVETSETLSSRSEINCEDANKKLAEQFSEKVKELGFRFLGANISNCSELPGFVGGNLQSNSGVFVQSMTIRYSIEKVLGHY